MPSWLHQHLLKHLVLRLSQSSGTSPHIQMHRLQMCQHYYTRPQTSPDTTWMTTSNVVASYLRCMVILQTTPKHLVRTPSDGRSIGPSHPSRVCSSNRGLRRRLLRRSKRCLLLSYRHHLRPSYYRHSQQCRRGRTYLDTWSTSFWLPRRRHYRSSLPMNTSTITAEHDGCKRPSQHPSMRVNSSGKPWRL